MWSDFLLTVALLAAIAIPVGSLVSPLWGAGVALGLALTALAYHCRQLAVLTRWAKSPAGGPLPNASGAWEGVFRALSRRARQASALRERLGATLDRFREAAQAMPDGVVFLSHTGEIEWLNRRAEACFGLDAARDKGAPLTNLVRQPDFVRYLESNLFNEPFLFHPLHRRAAALLVQVISFGDGRRIVIARDVSQLEKLENMRRDFVANVSHELRTPLTVVSGFLETVLDAEDALSPEEMRTYLGMAKDQAARMQRLIQDLLTLSTLETDAPLPPEEDIEVNALVREIARETEALSAGRHDVQAEINGACHVLGSTKELHSAFANLASNAVRYTPDGGSIHLSWAIRADGCGEYCVRDSGIGVAAEHVDRLTERFYRVDRGRSRETGGTGLGLAIVKHVLTRHQGQLRVRSTPGKGSEFCLLLPASRVIRSDRVS